MDRRPPVTPEARLLDTFHEGLAAGELRVRRCTSCGTAQFPPRAVCPACATPGAAEWITTGGRGRVWSFGVFHKAYLPDPAPQPPYNVAVVQLDEGPKVITNIVAVPLQEIRVGMAVEAVFATHEPAVRFRPVDPDHEAEHGADHDADHTATNQTGR
ncbi:Zn-ribbon domain-containing OB-fold protein [Pseudonocardia sp.]|uniref:Zn-ribbon domain-containing OB-fold protein n=1 Tax=Pseudonocardia sp. TaxID=60912 RepID=UPI003D109A80